MHTHARTQLPSHPRIHTDALTYAAGGRVGGGSAGGGGDGRAGGGQRAAGAEQDRGEGGRAPAAPRAAGAGGGPRPRRLGLRGRQAGQRHAHAHASTPPIARSLD